MGQRRRWDAGGVPLVILFLLPITIAEYLQKQSFEAPLLDYDHRGRRQIPYWQAEGATIIKQSFVRLTTDKENEYGSIWTRIPADGLKEFSVAAKVRASGRSDAEWGKSLGIFFTNSETAKRPGPTFGVAEDFAGLAVVMHRSMAPVPEGSQMQHFYSTQQLSLIANDGTRRSRDQLLRESAQFCHVRARFLETRDDFSVLEGTLLRLTFHAGSVHLEVDDRNNGQWRHCASLPPERTFSEMWLPGLRVGVVAETGDLRDNHDVLSFKMWDTALEAREWTPGYEANRETPSEESRYAQLMHHLEHELFEVNSRLQGALDRLEERAGRDVTRLEQLEETLGEQVVVALEHRVMDVETRLHRTAVPEARYKIAALEDKMATKIDSVTDHEVGQAAAAYRVPFFLVLLLLLGAAIVAYKQLASIEKQALYA